jgi:hypothetical protein
VCIASFFFPFGVVKLVELQPERIFSESNDIGRHSKRRDARSIVGRERFGFGIRGVSHLQNLVHSLALSLFLPLSLTLLWRQWD